MAALLDEEERSGFRSLRRGDVVEGTIISIGRDSVVVDIGTKSEGVIPASEMRSLGAEPLSRVSVGQQVVASVIQPETSEGEVLLSLDRARGERGWRTLQQLFEQGESFEAEVGGYNKGGLLVNVEGVPAFVPMSQLVGLRPDRGDDASKVLAEAVGKSLRLKVIELNRRRNRVILSERGAVQEWRTQQKDRLLSELREGEVRRGRISSIRNFGIFVDLGGADGLVHLSEVSWMRNRAPEDLYKVGDEVDVYVMKIDQEAKKIQLSIRRAEPQVWDEIVDKFEINEVVPGIVTKLVTFGAFARIEGPVEGLVHVSELVDRRISHPKEAVREGDIIPLRILQIEKDRHRLHLSMKQARERAEVMGFEFGPDGEVVYVPEEVRQSLAEEVTSITGSPPPAQEPGARRSRSSRDGAREEPATAPAEAEEELPQTQMAAAFAALKLDERLGSDEPPAEEQ
jgi:small subunit ribosomal protein S1